MTSEEKEKFLSRWSRLKERAKEEGKVSAAVRAADEPRPAPAVDPKSPPPELPPIDKLTIDSDFRDFFHPKVDENLRRAALKKLFADPHFNVMDGLDVYIDDYSQPNPLPAAMLAGLKQAQNILEWAREGKAEAGETSGQASADAPARTAEAVALPQPDGGRAAPASGETAAPEPQPAQAPKPPATAG